MKHLTKEYLFPLITAGNDILHLIPKYNTVMDKLAMLEAQFQKIDAGFDMAVMWTCTAINGELVFDITSHCRDMVLEYELLDIFCASMSTVVA